MGRVSFLVHDTRAPAAALVIFITRRCLHFSSPHESDFRVQRRDAVKSVLAIALLGSMPRAMAQASTTANSATVSTRFTLETVPRLAQAMARQPYRAPDERLPAVLEETGYDAYRDLRFDPTQAIWRKEGLPFQLQMFHRGFLFKQRVEL
jgi:periplasmic glucans biosynthesis protein